MSARRPSLGWLKVALALCGMQGLVVGGYFWIEQQRERKPSGAIAHYERLPRKAAADLRLVAADETTTKLSVLRGKPVLLHFWATWCGPCEEELPGLLELGLELERTDRARLVALSVDRDWDAIRTFFDGSVPAAVQRDGSGDATKAFDVAVLPDTYLIRADGSVAGRFGGARDWRSADMRTTLDTELKR